MCVTRMDGRLGAGGDKGGAAVGGGLHGMLKCLAREWPDVFCRGVDIAPQTSPGQAAAAVSAEFQDPARYPVTVGYAEDGVRNALVAKACPLGSSEARESPLFLSMRGTMAVAIWPHRPHNALQRGEEPVKHIPVGARGRKEKGI